MKIDVGGYLERLHAALDAVDRAEIALWADLIYGAWREGRAVFIFGNGGSGTTASHMAEDLGKSLVPGHDFLDDTARRLRVMSLTDNVGWILAVGNDIGFEQIFQQQLMNYGRSGDLAIAISGSGNSPNVLAAVDWANRSGLTTFGLTGFDGGRLKQIQQTGLHVPVDDMGMVESVHTCISHWVVDEVAARINAS
jgi:D-sedoheptulose 7-phosphate isomerase